MARLETWYKQDLKKPLIVHKHADVFNQDSRGNLIGVEVYKDGEPVTLAGSISGYCLLADGTTVPAVSASRSGNKASVLIPQTAYSVPGPITITVKNVEGNDIATLCAVVGLVRQSVSGNLANPGSVVTDWSNSINAQLQAVQTAADNVGAIVAAPFDENTVYVVGNYVTNNGNLYRITGDHASGVAWADTSKVQCTVGSELSDLKSAFDNNINYFSDPTYNLIDINKQIARSASVGIASNKKIRVTATESGTYAHCMFVIPVTGITNVKITFNMLVSATGSGRVRLGYSTDGTTFAGWINTVSSGDTFDVSSYDYICLALYAVWTSNTGIGHFVDYENVMVISGTEEKTYLPGRMPTLNTEIIDARKGINGNIYNSLGEAIRTQVSKNLAFSNKNYGIINDGFVVVDNFIYDANRTAWDTNLVIPAIENGNITVTAPTSGASYVDSQCLINVSDLDTVTLSYDEITGDTGTSQKLRYGYVTNGSATWIGFTTNKKTTVDVSDYDTMILGFYVYYNVSSVEGKSSTFKKVQLERGSSAHEFTESYYVADIHIGEGNTQYYGERLNISDELKPEYRCQEALWANYQNVQSWGLNQNQSIAMYGGYAFAFLNGGGCVVIDYETKELLTSMTLDVSANHNNSAQFTSIFYDENDDFPLILLSRCGNAQSTSDDPLPGTDGCIIARITKSGNTFSISLVNLIVLNKKTYGTSWCIDEENNRIYVCCNTVKQNYNTDKIIYGFVMPTTESIKSGSQITFDVSEAVFTHQYDAFVLQGMHGQNGKIYIAVQETEGHWVYVVSEDNGKIVTKVPVNDSYEPEGVTIYNGFMYVSVRQGTDSSGVNPMKIYEIK